MPDIQADAAQVEVCGARPRAAPSDIQAPPGASADVSSDLSGAGDIDTTRGAAEIRLGPGQGPGVDL